MKFWIDTKKVEDVLAPLIYGNLQQNCDISQEKRILMLDIIKALKGNITNIFKKVNMPRSQLFVGTCYNPKFDKDRLNKLLGRVYDVVKDSKKRSIKQIKEEIKNRTGRDELETSVHRCLYYLKEDKYGGFCLQKEKMNRLDSGYYVYWIEEKKGQGRLFY